MKSLFSRYFKIQQLQVAGRFSKNNGGDDEKVRIIKRAYFPSGLNNYYTPWRVAPLDSAHFYYYLIVKRFQAKL